MQNNQKESKTLRYFKFLFVFVAVILTVVPFLTLTTIYKILDADMYKEALSQSGIYSVTTQVVENRITDTLITLQKGVVVELGIVENEEDPSILNNILVFVINTLIEEASTEIVANFSQNIGLEEGIKNTAENSIDNSISWLKGDVNDPKIFAYIPPPEQIKAIRDANLSDFVYYITGEIFGTNNLPECQSPEEVRQTLIFLSNRELENVSCTNEDLNILISGQIEEIIPSKVLADAEREFMTFLDSYKLTPVIDQFFEVSLFISNAKNTLINFRESLQTTKEVSVLALFSSTIFVGFAVYLQEKGKRLKLFFEIYLVSGVILIVYSLLHYVFLSKIISDTFAISDVSFSEGFMTPEQEALFLNSLNSAFLYLLRNLSSTTLLVGLLIFFVFFLPFLLIKAGEKRKEREGKEIELEKKRTKTKKKSTRKTSKK
jgi:hypothetical protein